MATATMVTDPRESAMLWSAIGAEVTGPVAGVWTVTAPVTQAVLDMHVTNAVAEAAAKASGVSRRAKITGAKARAREISVLAQTPAARTGTAWTQVQRVAILDGIADLSKMLAWLADDLLAAPEPPD